MSGAKSGIRKRGPRQPTSVISPALPEDLDAILALEAACFAEADRFTRPAWRRLLGHCSRRRTALTLVARSSGRLVGVVCGLLRRGSRVLRIYSLAVDPACRGQGLGGRLIRTLVDAAPRRCVTASLEVRTDNDGAILLYTRLGFLQAVVLPRYYPDGGDGLRLSAARAMVSADR
jgi:[ribosomal protein S18]-alanine N-acetyltransferase